MFNFSESLARGLDVLGLEVEPKSVGKLAVYFDELKKWSAKVNLIAKSSSEEQILEKHFIDSLILVPLLTGSGKHLLDIGSGAGFPGLVCKTVCPDLEVTLVEPRLKRVSFLKHIARVLQLEKVHVVPARIESVSGIDPETVFTHITARAVCDIGGFLKMAEPFGASGTHLLCMKGPKWKEELVQAESILEMSVYSLATVEKCFLPFSGAERGLLIFKHKHT